MIDRGVQTILCARNGISLEPHALAYYAGFQVTAVDISLEATKFTRDLHPNSKHLRHFFVRGMPRALKGSGRTLSFLVRPAMLLADYVHERYLARRIGRRGGMLVFSTGDLLDPDFCPGPFDVVIERRTVQLFPKSERDRILDRLATRLKPGGIFVSHYHMGWWRPGESREHFAEPWFRERGFTIAKGISKGAERPPESPCFLFRPAEIWQSRRFDCHLLCFRLQRDLSTPA